jgi:starch synthase
MSLKLYFLTAEIDPFANTSPLSFFSKKIPEVYNEKRVDVRLMMPKYGYISERKYVLREVIRLRDIQVQSNDKTLHAAVKSAFVPNTKVQVYFQVYPPFFKEQNRSLYYDIEGNPLDDNDQRYTFFSVAALHTLKFLYWKPDFILCNDWQTAPLPILLKEAFYSEEWYENVQTTFILHNPSLIGNYNGAVLSQYGVKNQNLLNNKNLDLIKTSMEYADTIFFIQYPDIKELESFMQREDILTLLESKKDRYFKFQMRDLSADSWRQLADDMEAVLSELVEKPVVG